MNVYPAKLTLEKINSVMKQDQGASYRFYLEKSLPEIKDAYDTSEDSFRSHLGASIIGDECPRKSWYSFRWFYKEKFDGRMLRLFNRGHLEEGRFIAALQAIGCQVWQSDSKGNQFRIYHANGHAGGSCDGVAKGFPEFPDKYVLTEFKTHSEKSFTSLLDKGLHKSKLTHYVQMCLYMEKLQLDYGMYFAVNKNTDEIYAEIVPANRLTAEKYLSLMENIVETNKPPTRIHNSGAFYKCKFCIFNDICHFEAEPAINCRTCKYSKAIANANWVCTLTGEILNKEKQLTGCDSYIRLV